MVWNEKKIISKDADKYVDESKQNWLHKRIIISSGIKNFSKIELICIICHLGGE